MQSQSLMRQPPSESERLVIHEQFLRTTDMKNMSFKSRVKPANSVWMEDAKLKNLFICQPEVSIMWQFLRNRTWKLFFNETVFADC